MSISFKEQFDKERLWDKRSVIIEIYHLSMTSKNKGWGVVETANYFKVSIGHVSENLKLARALHRDPTLADRHKTRYKALAEIQGEKIK
jgi:hypothetical protein